jgi:hypothetical protein
MLLRICRVYTVFHLTEILANRQWRFEPGLRGGQPVDVPIKMEVLFTLQY